MDIGTNSPKVFQENIPFTMTAPLPAACADETRQD